MEGSFFAFNEDDRNLANCTLKGPVKKIAATFVKNQEATLHWVPLPGRHTNRREPRRPVEELRQAILARGSPVPSHRPSPQQHTQKIYRGRGESIIIHNEYGPARGEGPIMDELNFRVVIFATILALSLDVGKKMGGVSGLL